MYTLILHSRSRTRSESSIPQSRAMCNDMFRIVSQEKYLPLFGDYFCTLNSHFLWARRGDIPLCSCPVARYHCASRLTASRFTFLTTFSIRKSFKMYIALIKHLSGRIFHMHLFGFFRWFVKLPCAIKINVHLYFLSVLKYFRILHESSFLLHKM